MPAADLGIYLSNAELEVEELEASKAKWSQEIALVACQRRRLIGIAYLLLTGSAQEFHAQLRASGQAYLDFLRGTAPRFTSRIDPLFDAIAAGDLGRAQAMARALGSAWNDAEEYEEDYLYAMLLGEVLLPTPPRSEAVVMLARFQALTLGQRDSRCEVCTAYLAGDAAQFEIALEQLLVDYHERQQRMWLKGAIAPEVHDTLGKINVEGLAWIGLGLGRGYALQAEYLLAPSLARAAVTRPR